MLREELEDRFGPVPDAAGQPDPAPGRPHQARPRGGPHGGLRRRQAGRVARSTSTRGGSRSCASGCPEAIYESGRSTVRVRVPDEPAARFPAVVAAAEAILEAASAP